MGRRSSVETLPNDIRRQVDEKLVAGGFSDYEGMVAWLADIGVAVSKSALHRYGQGLEDQYNEAMGDARALLALTRAAGDLGDAGSEIAAGAATILQTDIVRTALEIRRENDPEKRASLLAKLTRAQADIGRMTISVDRHRAELREKFDAKFREMEAQTEGGKKASFDLDTLRRVREEIYGIV